MNSRLLRARVSCPCLSLPAPVCPRLSPPATVPCGSGTARVDAGLPLALSHTTPRVRLDHTKVCPGLLATVPRATVYRAQLIVCAHGSPTLSLSLLCAVPYWRLIAVAPKDVSRAYRQKVW